MWDAIIGMMYAGERRDALLGMNSEMPEEWRKHARAGPWRRLFPDVEWVPEPQKQRQPP